MLHEAQPRDNDGSRLSIVYVTAGTHGAGHLVRGIALGRALARTGTPHRYTLLAPPGPYTSLAAPWWSPLLVDPKALSSREHAPNSDLARAIAALAPDIVVLDLFWVPLVFVPINAPVWLLLRSVPEVWLRGPREAQFDAARYARVLAIEPAPLLERFENWPAIVCESTGAATASRTDLCAMVGADPNQRLRLRAQAGLPEDAAILLAAALERWGEPGSEIALESNNASFPFGRWLGALRGGDEVIAGAGYNLFWEAQHAGADARVHWVPLPRRIDDQAARIAFGRGANYPTDGADKLAAALITSLATRDDRENPRT